METDPFGKVRFIIQINSSCNDELPDHEPPKNHSEQRAPRVDALASSEIEDLRRVALRDMIPLLSKYMRSIRGAISHLRFLPWMYTLLFEYVLKKALSGLGSLITDPMSMVLNLVAGLLAYRLSSGMSFRQWIHAFRRRKLGKLGLVLVILYLHCKALPSWLLQMAMQNRILPPGYNVGEISYGRLTASTLWWIMVLG